MRSQLQLHRQYFRRNSHASQSREIQGLRREIRFGPRFGRGSRQIRVRHGQTFRELRVAEGGAAIREAHDARATGPRNAIDRAKAGELARRTAVLRNGAEHDRAGGRSSVCSRSDHGTDGCRCHASWARARRRGEGAPAMGRTDHRIGWLARLASCARQAARRRHGQGTRRYDGDRSDLRRHIAGRCRAIRT